MEFTEREASGSKATESHLELSIAKQIEVSKDQQTISSRFNDLEKLRSKEMFYTPLRPPRIPSIAEEPQPSSFFSVEPDRVQLVKEYLDKAMELVELETKIRNKVSKIQKMEKEHPFLNHLKGILKSKKLLAQEFNGHQPSLANVAESD